MAWIVAWHAITVLVPGLFGLLLVRRSGRLTAVLGEDSPARRVLACLYLAIAVSSAWALLDGDLLVVTAGPVPAADLLQIVDAACNR